MRTGLDDDGVASGELLVHDHLIPATAERRHSTELEVRVVTRKAVLACEVHLLAADSEHRGDLPQIDPVRGRDYGSNVAARRGQDERLRHLVGSEAERNRFLR